MRIYRHSVHNTQPQESIDLENRVWRYQSKADTSDHNRNIILDTCKPILRTRGISWNADAEQLVLDAVERFNPFFGIGFLTFLISCLESQTGPRRPYTDEETLEADAYDGTGYGLFERTWTSSPERVSIAYAAKSKKGVQVYEGENNDIV